MNNFINTKIRKLDFLRLFIEMEPLKPIKMFNGDYYSKIPIRGLLIKIQKKIYLKSVITRYTEKMLK